MQCNEYIPDGDETIDILGHYVNCHPDKMHRCLTNWMEVHRYFVEQVGGDLICQKGQDIEDYLFIVVQPQMPLDKIALLLYACMYKIHICVILEGKYWCTDRDEALNRATIYLIYQGHMQFSDTTRKGSLHSSMFEEIGSGTYQLHSHGPIDKPKEAPGCWKTLNSIRAGLMEEKELQKAKCEYDKLNKILQEHKKPRGTPKPKDKPKLKVEIHGIPVWKPRERDLKCLVCKDIFNLVKDLNVHIKEKHPRFRYKCTHCTRRFLNYASRYKHDRKQGTPSHVCKQCKKGFKKNNLTVHSWIHSGKGLFHCTNCSNTYITRAAMDTHRLVHLQPKFQCDKCNLSMDTAANLRQHQRGKHGRGWKAPCGKRYDWPAKCSATNASVLSV